MLFVDCEQSARAREHRGDERNEGGSLSRLAPSVFVVICVSQVFRSTDEEKLETVRSLRSLCISFIWKKNPKRLFTLFISTLNLLLKLLLFFKLSLKKGKFLKTQLNRIILDYN